MTSKRTRSLMGLVAVMSLMLFLHADVVEAASVAIDNATVSYGGSNQVVPDDLSNVDSDAVLVSFVADYVTYSDLVLVDSVTTNEPQSWESHQYGISGTDPGSPVAAVTDNRLDSGIANVYTNAVFKFASAPTSLSDVFFLFEWSDGAHNDKNDSIQLVDSSTNNIGTAVPMANLAWLGGSALVTLTNKNAGIRADEPLSGVAIPLSDFVTAVQLSNVAGFRITDSGADPADIDLLIAGIASPLVSAQADLITPSSVIASSDAPNANPANDRSVENLLDGEEMFLAGGLDADNPYDWRMNHSGDRYGSGDAWAANTGDDTAKWVIMDLGSAYELSAISIWNMNPNTIDSINRSAKTVNIYYSMDRTGDGNVNNVDELFSNTGNVWTSYVTGKSVTKNPSNTIVTYPNALLNNMNTVARYIAFDFTDAHKTSNLDKVTVQEIQVFGSPYIPPPKGTVISIQ